MARGHRGIAVPTLAFAPVQRVVAGGGRIRPPGLRSEGAEGAAVVRPMPPQRALDRQARDGESKFKSRQQAWPSSPDAGFPGQAASLRGGETFLVPPR